MKQQFRVFVLALMATLLVGCFVVTDGPVGNQYVKCARDYQCAQTMTCSIEGICEHTAPLGCANDQECFKSQFCGWNGLCHDSTVCDIDSDCAENEQCRADQCHPSFVCTSDTDCPADSYCDLNGYSKTLYGCGSQDECSGGFYCGIDGFCWPTPLPENTPAASEPETNDDESTADSSP